LLRQSRKYDIDVVVSSYHGMGLSWFQKHGTSRMNEYKHMLDSITAHQRNCQGVPVTEPLTNPWQVREMLTNMSIAYPGEIFSIESPVGDDDRTMVVTWIPQFYTNQFLS